MPLVLLSLLLLLLAGPSAAAQTEDEAPSFLSESVTLVPAVAEVVILKGGSSEETLELRAVGVPGVQVDPSQVTLPAHGVAEVSVLIERAVTPRGAYLIATRDDMLRARVPISLASDRTSPVPERLVLRDIQFHPRFWTGAPWSGPNSGPNSGPPSETSIALGPLFAGVSADIGVLSAGTGGLAQVTVEDARLVVSGLERGSYSGSVAIPGVPGTVAVELDVRHHWLFAALLFAALAFLHAYATRFRETDQPFTYRLLAVQATEKRMRKQREVLQADLCEKLGDQNVCVPRVDGPGAALQNESQRLVDAYMTTSPGERAAWVAEPNVLEGMRGIAASYTGLLAKIRTVLSQIGGDDASDDRRTRLRALLTDHALLDQAAVDALASEVQDILDLPVDAFAEQSAFRRARTPTASRWTRTLRIREVVYALATAATVVAAGLVALYWTQPDFGGLEDYLAMAGWTAVGGEGANYLKRFLLR